MKLETFKPYTGHTKHHTQIHRVYQWALLELLLHLSIHRQWHISMVLRSRWHILGNLEPAMAHMDFVDFPAMKATKPHVFLYKNSFKRGPLSQFALFQFQCLFSQTAYYSIPFCGFWSQQNRF